MPNNIYQYQPIDPIECMGDSLAKINNNNFLADGAIGILETRIVAASANIKTEIASVSSDLNTKIISLSSATGPVVQSFYSETKTVTTITTNAPDDESPPLYGTEMTPILSVTITPKFSNSDIYCQCFVTGSGGGNLIKLGVYDNTVNGSSTPFGLTAQYMDSSNGNQLSLQCRHQPGSLSSKTYSMCLGNTAGGTQFRLNRVWGNHTYGGNLVTSFLVQEIRNF